jgi:sugar (pentulose or hexulose) kinase
MGLAVVGQMHGLVLHSERAGVLRRPCTDPTDASGTLLYDLERGAWSSRASGQAERAYREFRSVRA